MRGIRVLEKNPAPPRPHRVGLYRAVRSR